MFLLGFECFFFEILPVSNVMLAVRFRPVREAKCSYISCFSEHFECIALLSLGRLIIYVLLIGLAVYNKVWPMGTLGSRVFQKKNVYHYFWAKT